MIRIGAKPESDFNDPMGLLSDCHRRVERFLAQLLAVLQRSRGGPMDPEAREALETALRYFKEAAPKHTEDEEASLFPRMRALGNPDVDAALTEVERLEADHLRAAPLHDTVDALGRRWLSEGTLAAPDTQALAAALEELRAMYEAHIALEDNHVFPLAGRTLDPDDIRAVGREMAERRGLNPDAPAPKLL